MHRKSSDLLLVSGVAIAATMVILTGGNNSWLRPVLGLPLVLVLPGYTLTEALFPDRPLPLVEQAVFTCGLSLIVVVLAGLILNMLPQGLRAESWGVLLGCITLVCAAVAFCRRPQAVRAADWHRSLPSIQGVLFGLTAVYVAGTLGFAQMQAAQSLAVPATQLWALPATQPGNPSIRVGINNGPTTGQYVLQVQQAGFSIQSWPTLDLAPAGHWETTLVLPPRQANSGQVEILLYRRAAPNVVYRRVMVASGDGQRP